MTRTRKSPPFVCLLRAFVLLLLTVLPQVPAKSQGENGGTILNRGLIIRSAPGFPDNIAMKNPIEGAIVDGRWQAPKAGESIRFNDTVSGTWRDVAADSAGWFRDSLLRGAYVYIELEWPREESMLLEPMGNAMAYVNGEPRAGNPYGSKDLWEPWEPRFDFASLPVKLLKGTNRFLFQCTRGILKVRLRPPAAARMFGTRDCTLPDLIEGEAFDGDAAVVVVNASTEEMRGWHIGATLEGEREIVSSIPVIQPMSVRKSPFVLRTGARKGGPGLRLFLRLLFDGKQIDTASTRLRLVKPSESYKVTFRSSIDSSVQYFAVNPASGGDGRKALVLSLHGAGVEAINQATSYSQKSWATIVCPTNRRPYGFNWEDWGRSDALEVLDIAKRKFNIDASRIYLTGHSMGGHGTYHIGSLLPDQFGAIAPSAGWISFWTYRVREKMETPTPFRQMLMRPALASDTYGMARNYSGLGVYILHGSEDDNVLPRESRSMAEHLGTFHKDFVYHEQNGVGHWWDNSDEPGADCVDWAPLFDFFARHARPEAARIRELRFVTPNPGISSRYYWASIEAQTEQLKLSSIDLRSDPGSRRFVGKTENVRRLAIEAGTLLAPGNLTVELDSQKLEAIAWPQDGTLRLERRAGKWGIGQKPSLSLKGPHRYGTFRDAIRNNVVFLFGTSGTAEENRWAFAKSRFDAERFWYQGNGSIEVLADTEYVAAAAGERNIVLYGNASTNRAWKALLGESPVQMINGAVTVGKNMYKGDDLSSVFVRPLPGSASGVVGVVGGSGIAGMRGTNGVPYLLPGIGFPDLLVTRTETLTKGESGGVVTGFFGDDWSVENGEFVP